MRSVQPATPFAPGNGNGGNGAGFSAAPGGPRSSTPQPAGPAAAGQRAPSPFDGPQSSAFAAVAGQPFNDPQAQQQQQQQQQQQVIHVRRVYHVCSAKTVLCGRSP